MILEELGDGLILRRSTPADAEALAAFNAEVHGDTGSKQPDQGAAAWTRDLLTRPHPSFHPEDFTIVEDTRRGAIVSSMNLIDERWTYAGIPFDVGQPELVGTHPDYRDRGLVRLQFAVIHEWSARRGQLVQAITGIPYYYRQFGYEMALELGGSRTGACTQVPALRPGSEEPCTFRPAAETDLPFLMRMREQSTVRSLVACPWDETGWRYALGGRSRDNDHRTDYRIIERPGGDTVGLVGYRPRVRHWTLAANLLEIAPGVSWLEIGPAVLRHLAAEGSRIAGETGADCQSLGLALGSQHPAYPALQQWLPQVNNPYAWYLRVPDLPAFLWRIAPALEARLAGSPAAGHSGELKLSFYRSGLRISLDHGRLAATEPYRPLPDVPDDAGFPGLAFLQLVFGFRDLHELRYAFPDCWVSGTTAEVLLTSLFPKVHSRVYPLL